MRIIDAYTVRPDSIKQGDVMLFVVKAIVVRPGRYRIYRCRYEHEGIPQDSLPQGPRIFNEAAVAQAVFPALTWVAEPDPV